MKSAIFFSINWMTSTFYLDLIFKAKGQGWCFICFGVCMTNNFKVIIFSVKKNKILLGAMSQKSGTSRIFSVTQS
jgi:hypothetical protein